MPASNMKLFTAATALGLLRPEFRYQTQYLIRGSRNGKTITGDFIVKGMGDPSLALFNDVTQTEPDSLTSTSALSKILSNLKTVTGSVQIDNSYFTKEYYPVGWQLDDLPFYYAPPVSATIYDANQAAVYVTGGDKVGGPSYQAESGSEDQLPYGTIKDLSVTVDHNAPTTVDAARILGTDTILIAGNIQQDSQKWMYVSINDPVKRNKDYYETVLEENQVRVLGRRTRNAGAIEQLIGLEPSRTLSDLVKHMDKESDNLYAECFLRTVGKEKGGEGSWTRGIEVMRKYLASIGIDTLPLQFTDGSGLSRMDFVTTDAIVNLLSAMWNDPKLKDPFYNSLPIAGVDGTFKNHLKGTAAEGNARGKSGSMTGVRALSGYLTTKDGEPIAYSIIANNYSISGSEVGKLEDSVVLRLVNFSRK